MGKVKVKDRKSGPRGKKARELRKIQRRWGEEVNEEEVQRARIRKGVGRLTEEQSKSRVLGKKPHVSTDEWKLVHNDRPKSTSTHDPPVNLDSDPDTEEDVNMDPTRTSLQSLLQSIQKSRQVRHLHSEEATDSLSDNYELEESSDESFVEMEKNGTMNGEEEKQEKEEVVVEDDNDDDEEQNDSEDSSSITYIRNNHPFYRHCFPTDAQVSVMENTTTTTKAMGHAINNVLNPNLQLQVSQQLLLRYDSHSFQESLEYFQKISNQIVHQGPQQLRKEWGTFNSHAYRHNVDTKSKDEPTSSLCSMNTLQSVLFPFLAQYADTLLTCETRENKESIRNILILHTLNHILQSNRLISRNNKRLKVLSNKDASSTVDSLEGEIRDQGYTRPKVLVLLPTRGVCLAFIHKLVQLLGPGSKVDNLERFEAEYSVTPDNVQDLDNDKRRKAVLNEKGPDWLEFFGDEVNSDDDFKLGISFQNLNLKSKGKSPRRNVHMKLFSEFYHSDMILASPLALKIHSDSDENEDRADYDFLSSIEICILLDCDVLLMQNWDHVNSVLDHMNHQPTRIEGIDFSRVRNLFLSGLASKFRQTILVSRFMDPNLISSFRKYAQCCSGFLKIRRVYTEDMASIGDVLIRARQVFQRIPSDSFLSQGDDRLKYFTNNILPHILRLEQKHTMIFIPSYFDFTAVRNLLLKKEVSFVSITEYARTSEISRGRARFLQGRKDIMLYTGRSFFFMRHFIKGVKHLVFFGLPEHGEFYPNLVNMMSVDHLQGTQVDISIFSCLCLYTKYDAHALERIVGTKYCDTMINGEKGTFLFNS